MKNRYEIRGEVTAIFVRYSKTGEELETLIDTKDLPRAQEFPKSWFARFEKSTGTFYVNGSPPKKNTTIQFHRWLLGTQKEFQVDHRDGNTMDNRCSNLRECSHAQNMQNKRAYQKNSSGIRGVCWHGRDQKWMAQLQVNKKKIHLGCFDDINEAAKVVEKAREQHMPYAVNR